MSKRNSPYRGLPDKAFWRTAIAERSFFDLEDVSRPVQLTAGDKIATAGSCFAQHIGRHLQRRGASYMDMEPRPAFLPESHGKRFGYDTYSCRYGNIYTTRQLLQLTSEALLGHQRCDAIWMKNGRYFDALRPSVDPVGYESSDQILALRRRHLDAVAKMFRQLDVFVFTLGLTEAWVSTSDGTAFPTAAGTVIGEHDSSKYEFKNFRYAEVYDDLARFIYLLRTVNDSSRIVLTVSPVPLNATASLDHVMVATARSKAVLRAVAGDIAEDVSGVFYFPSYEIISSHPSRGMFFEPDQRNVNEVGVDYVMKHFFKASNLTAPPDCDGEDCGLVCDEAALDQFI